MLGGCRICGINYLFFKSFWKTKGKRLKIKMDPQPDSSVVDCSGPSAGPPMLSAAYTEQSDWTVGDTESSHCWCLPVVTHC